MATADVTVPFFKKKGKARPTTTRRQRSASPEASAQVTGPFASSSKTTVVLPNRKAAGNLLSAGTKRKRIEGDGTEDVDERNGPDVQWTAAGSHQHAAQDILDGDEAEAMLLAKKARSSALDEDDEDMADDGLYHGQSAYKSHLKKNKEVPKAMRVGPQRNTSTIRQITIVDYQPDVCKDYKETGYCGFGDTCKFLHDRGTYLQGWQLDKIADGPAKDARDASDSDSEDEDIPFACLICRNAYTEPVVTRCGHYFCSACAIKRFAKTPKCAACLAPTGGIFNRADKIIEKRNKVKEKKAEAGYDDEDRDGEVHIEGLGGGDHRPSKEDSASDSEDDDE